ncbi:MAG: SIMPL domain-containing protein [Acidimicrobiales bacterium]
MKPSHALSVLVAAIVVAAAIGLGDVLGRAHVGAPRTISVTGLGVVRATPDTFSFSIDVHTTGASTAAALVANDARTRQVDAALRAAGVAAGSLATTSLAVSPTYGPQGQITGYGVDDQIDVTSHLVDRAGTILGAAIDAAGNAGQVSGLTFSLSAQSPVRARARVAAVANADHAARELARAAGAHLGPVVSLVDHEHAVPLEVPLPVFASTAAVPRVPVSPATQSVAVSVAVVYQLT